MFCNLLLNHEIGKTCLIEVDKVFQLLSYILLSFTTFSFSDI